jgi:alkanesulfonate monooxygenase SsuD/methylene tetrahydromethanopterin reductase-like flavin-dependent oxidoreductase (luciferase family)
MLTVRYDLRAPSFGPVGHPERYAACLDQCAWADERGFDLVVLSEHHGVEDGYLPSPVVLAAAVAGRTRKANIWISAILVPLYEPLRLAEDLAVLDLASGGRIGLVAGIGYRPEEFAMLGVDRKRRGALLEEHLAVLQQAWTGEPFEYQGRTVQVTPRPLQQPHPLLFVGGSTDVAATRAARLGLNFFPAVGDEALAQRYREECQQLGKPEGLVILPQGAGFLHVAEDPEKAWTQIAPYAQHEATSYDSWQTEGQRSQVHTAAQTPDELRASGQFPVLTPDECVALAQSMGPMDSLVFHPMLGGIPPDLAWESLELFAAKVLPRIRP